MRTRLSLGLVLAITLGGLTLTTIPASAQSPFPDLESVLPTGLSVRLTGTAEVPGPGDPDGCGFAGIAVLSAANTVCYVVSVSNVDTPTAAHIHAGSASVAGPVVLPLRA